MNTATNPEKIQTIEYPADAIPVLSTTTDLSRYYHHPFFIPSIILLPFPFIVLLPTLFLSPAFIPPFVQKPNATLTYSSLLPVIYFTNY